jgi:hypothetical protein
MAAMCQPVVRPGNKGYDPSVKTGLTLMWDTPQCPCRQPNTTAVAERVTHLRYHHQPYRLRYACPHCLSSLASDLGTAAKGHSLLHPQMCSPGTLVRLHVWNLIPLEWVGSMIYGGECTNTRGALLQHELNVENHLKPGWGFVTTTWSRRTSAEAIILEQLFCYGLWGRVTTNVLEWSIHSSNYAAIEKFLDSQPFPPMEMGPF